MVGWIECEIVQKPYPLQNVLEDILVELYRTVIIAAKKSFDLESWHFFREPTLRFRMELRTKDRGDITHWYKIEIDKVLRGLREKGKVDRWSYTKHGKKGTYDGEADSYGAVGFKYQKDVWYANAELAIRIITMDRAGKLEYSEGWKQPMTRELHYRRIKHLVYNQILPEIDE